MVGVVSLCPGAPRGVCAAPNFSVDGAGVSGIIDSIGSSGGEQYGPGLGPESGLLPSLTVCVP